VVAHLGVAMTEGRRRVLLVDMDVRRPYLHQFFELPNENGLAEYLALEGPAPPPVEDYILPTKFSGLSILPAGVRKSETSHWLYANNLRAVLDQLKEQFDIVLIDAPPMLHFSDARILGQLSDGVILVIRSGKTDRNSALLACRLLAEDGAQLIGTVLNDLNLKDGVPYHQYAGYYKKDVRNSGA
jgi:capsular exopolysaccharide synthesis family protein